MEKIACLGENGEQCEYRSSWFCMNPKCKSPVLTSTLIGAKPNGCPKADKWNRKEDK